jgi:glyoxylase-like metal-dependent hydrolase (beta-lactamase superfamily II)
MNQIPSYAVYAIPIYNVRIFLIEFNGKLILVDAGIPFTEDRLHRAFQLREIDPRMIDLILLTHGHLDHIGCLAHLKDISGAKVICHQSLAEILAAGAQETATPRVGIWRVFHQPISALLGSGLKPVQPEHTFIDSIDLDEFGIPGEMVHTPGHSSASSTLFLDGGICFLGDSLREVSPGRYDTGLFYDDREQIINSLKRITSYKPEVIYLSHGTTMTGDQLNAFLEKN